MACGLLTGVGDLITGDVEDEAGGDGVARPDAGGLDANELDAGSGLDAPPPPPTCVCVPAAPPGWTGPIAVIKAQGNAQKPPVCPAGLKATLEAGAGLAAPQSCSPCSCGSPTGACAIADVQGLKNACGDVNCGPSRPVGTNCQSFSGGCGIGSRAAQATASAGQGSCGPDGGVPPTSYATVGTGCAFAAGAPADAGCPTGMACAPASAAAPTAAKCIVRSGDVQCPGAKYIAASTYTTGVMDTRQCSACGCSAPSGVSCDGGVITLYATDMCANAITTEAVNGVCVDLAAQLLSAKMTTTPTSVGGACVPTGGGFLGGAATPSNPTTVCCLP